MLKVLTHLFYFSQQIFTTISFYNMRYKIKGASNSLLLAAIFIYKRIDNKPSGLFNCRTSATLKFKVTSFDTFNGTTSKVTVA